MSHKPIKRIIPVVLLLTIGITIWLLLKNNNFYYAGTIEATEVTLSSRVASVIDHMLVQEGTAVKIGQQLVTLTGEDLKLNAKIAASDYKRGEQLYKSGSLPQADFDKLTFQRDRTAMLVEWCSIKSPIDGVVLHTYREPGEMVAPGMQLLTLGNLSEVWAIIYVEQPMLAHLKVGQKVKGILPEMPDVSLGGEITVIKDEAEFTPKNVQTRKERSRLVYGIKIVFQNPDRVLKPGMTIEVDLPEVKK